MKKSRKTKQQPLPALTHVTNIKSNNRWDKEPRHSTFDGLCLQHFWQSAENPNEVTFQFHTYDLKVAKQFIKNNNSIR